MRQRKREREREIESERERDRETENEVISKGLKGKEGIVEPYLPALVNAMKCRQSLKQLLELELEPDPDSAFSMLSEEVSRNCFAFSGNEAVLEFSSVLHNRPLFIKYPTEFAGPRSF